MDDQDRKSMNVGAVFGYMKVMCKGYEYIYVHDSGFVYLSHTPDNKQ